MLAHQGLPVAPHDVWTAWSLNPAISMVAVSAVLWVRGARANRRPTSRWRAAAYFAGLAVVVAALVSPLEALSGVLFSAHMVQHLLLTLVAAPLLAVARPGRVVMRGLPRRVRRVGRRRGLLRHVAAWPRTRWLVVAWVVATGAFWAWHVPALYDAALDHTLVHVVEHVTLFASALVFWFTVTDSSSRATPALGAIAIFLASLTGGVLGALLTLSGRPWYEPRPGIQAWGLTPLEDQQVAGVIMWMPGGLVYLVAGVVLFAVWLSRAGGPTLPASGRHRPLRA